MNKILLLFFSFFLFTSLANGDSDYQVLKIEKTQEIYDTQDFIYYIEDKDRNFKAKDILNNKNLTLLSKSNVGVAKGPFYTRLQIENLSKKTQNFVLSNPLAGTNIIDVYIFNKDKLIAKHLLGDLRNIEQRKIKSPKSLFDISLKPNEHITIVSKIENYYIYNLKWEIIDINKHINDESYFQLIVGIITGIIVMFLLYNLLAYFIYKKIGFLLIAGYLFSAVSYQFGIYGIFYFMDIGLNLDLITTISWTMQTVAMMFLILFPYHFFEVGKKFKKLSYLLKFFVVIYLGLLLLTLYAQFIDMDYFFIIPQTSGYINILISLFLIGLGIFMYLKKELGSIYYTISQGMLLFSIVLYSLALYGVVPYFDQYKYIIPIAMVWDALIYLYIQFLKVKLEQKELHHSKQLMLEQSRFNSIGKSIGNITHQWKHPLSTLGYNISMLETVYKHDKNNFEEKYEQSIPKLNHSVELMSSTIDLFTKFYSGQIEKKEFRAKQMLNTLVLPMLEVKTIKKDIKFDIDIEDHLQILGYDTIFANIIMIIIDNSIDAFESGKENRIKISMVKVDNHYKLTYIDNAGGIDVKPIEKVFDPLFTTKGKKGSGLGLNMVQMLVQEQLNGTVSLQNYQEGIRLEIVFS